MKKSFNKLIILVFSLIILVACNKDDEVDRNDLLTAHTWKLQKYLRNGNDETSEVLISNFTEQFQNGGIFKRSYIDKDGDPFNETGEWQFDNNQNQVKVTEVSSVQFTDETSTVSSSDYNILILNDNDFWYTYDNGGDSHEFHFIPN